jgi:hypothetical protein
VVVTRRNMNKVGHGFGSASGAELLAELVRANLAAVLTHRQQPLAEIRLHLRRHGAMRFGHISHESPMIRDG